ncbi:MAG: hypothetical protein IT377_01120 [Polyangiaceae bacterium]|nr:hypothetical protein [Polyangiaceae bacterium]
MLDNLPIASITFVVGTLIVIAGYITGELSVEEALQTIGYVGAGSGLIGLARNGSGRGIK